MPKQHSVNVVDKDKDEDNDFGFNEIFIDCISVDSIVNATKNDQAFVKLYCGLDIKHVNFKLETGSQVYHLKYFKVWD